MGSTVIVIPEGEGVPPKENTKKSGTNSCPPIISFLREKKSRHVLRKMIHSIKVGVALVLVSLLYLLNPVYKQVGENAMWAIMTVVVIFEFYGGATLSKGINRGIGTVLGGGLGCLAAAFAQAVGGIGKAIVVGIAVFAFGAAATYTRQVPRIKKKYDYGAIIFILTFNLVVVSGLRVEQVLELARERLSTILMGFAICIFISLLVFPIWASDELHQSLILRFEDLARSLEGFTKEFFENVAEKENKSSADFSCCKSVLNSKAKDESLANFARWEPWNWKFGFSYPWRKYIKIGDDLRDLATTILSLKGCLRSPTQSSEALRQTVKEPCEAIVSSLAWTLRELGESIEKMRKCRSEDVVVPKLKSVRLELSLTLTPATLQGTNLENADGLGLASLVYSLMEMVEKMEELGKDVEELGELGDFHKK